MTVGWTSRLALPALVLGAVAAGGFCGAAAEDAGGKAEPQGKPAAAADAGASKNCAGISADFQTAGKRMSFVIALTNTCQQRLKCEVFAYVVGARGPASGHAVLVLGAKSSGAAAKKSYALPVKAEGGTAQISRDCKPF